MAVYLHARNINKYTYIKQVHPLPYDLYAFIIRQRIDTVTY